MAKEWSIFNQMQIRAAAGYILRMDTRYSEILKLIEGTAAESTLLNFMSDASAPEGHRAGSASLERELPPSSSSKG